MHDLNHEEDELIKATFKLIDDKKIDMVKYSEKHRTSHLKLVEQDINILQSYVSGVKQLDNQQIEMLLSSLVQYRVCLNLPLEKGRVIARARKKDDGKKYPHYDDVSEISYFPLKDQHKIEKPGRFNSKFQSMYYASVFKSGDDIETPFHEIDAQDKEHINLLVSEISEDLKVSLIGLFVYLQHKTSVTPYIHPKIFKKIYQYYKETHEQNLLQAIEKVDNFFKDITSKEVVDRDEQLRVYDITSTLGNIYLKDLPIDGLIYPSVKTDESPNIVIKPSSVDEKIKHLEAKILYVTYNENRQMNDAQELDNGKVDNCKILWRNNRFSMKQNTTA